MSGLESLLTQVERYSARANTSEAFVTNQLSQKEKDEFFSGNTCKLEIYVLCIKSLKWEVQMMSDHFKTLFHYHKEKNKIQHIVSKKGDRLVDAKLSS